MGEVFAGRYELLEPIGSGGMGTVWLVHDRRDGVRRAAKMIRQADAALLLRFVREQSVRIDHPHTVTPRGWAGADDTVLFTMDVVRGGSVHDLLRDYGSLPPEWVACLLDQLLDALSAVHAAGVVHRDVKPANLLLEPTGAGRPYLRLGDFGVAAPVHEPRMTAPAVVLGTRGYRAPEVLVGAEPDPAQDLWAAGVVLVQMLTGDRPPDGAGRLVEKPPSGVDPALWKVAVALTAPDPGARPASAGAARALLARTALVPAGDAIPDDEGREIEVLEHVARESVGAGPEPEESGTPPPEPVQAPATTRGRAPLRSAGYASIALGIVLLAVMGVLLLG
ncbi:protein kinase [Mumia sp. ZJ1417]|uniref:serine/threonine-protein kinase n=1 Tax=unclassified Mumia TaxID=2621872 RepID=UPI00141EC78F|nr:MULTISPECIES: serine/threonine-protein kinase [unclassified Mumia]QMW65607.1 protein kinase [Mumia sp. ZJ1417]